MLLKKLVFIAAALLMLGSGGIYAQDQGWYMGLGVGQSKAKDAESCANLDTDLGFPTAGASCSSKDTSTAKKVFGGYQFNHYLAVEAGYVDLGKFTISASKPTNPFGFTADGSDKASGFSVDAVGTWPITPEFGVLGRIGVFRWTLEASSTISTQFAGGPNGSASDKPSGTSADFGVGAKYDFTKNLGVRAEFQRFKSIGNNDTTGKSDVDLLSVSFIYSFR